MEPHAPDEGHRRPDDHRPLPGPLEALRRDRPALYASRHVIKATVEVVLATLGVGALLRALLPRINWDWVPHIVRPWWIPDPLGWLWNQSNLTIPDALIAFARSLRWWVPIAIAIMVALREIARRRSTDDDRDTDPEAAAGPDSDKSEEAAP